MKNKLIAYLRQQNLNSPTFRAMIDDHYYPLASRLLNSPHKVIGINGGQGTGKSTLAMILKIIIESAGKSVVVMSIDDFYLSLSRRKYLSKNIHPLLITRGVPGTHDVDLGLKLIQDLRDGKVSKIPVFDKQEDDIMLPENWQYVDFKADYVIFEGWCVGAKPISNESLFGNENELEQNYDPCGRWRNYYNDKLSNEYQKWFAHIDFLIMLKAPGIEEIIEWRSKQQLFLDQGVPTDFVVSDFVRYFERLTINMLKTVPRFADCVFTLDSKHNIC